MHITKFGHSCLLIEENDVRIIIDPGNYSTGQNDVKNVDAILITHSHQDHIDLSSVKKIIENNPDVKIFTNSEVGKQLDEVGISWVKLENEGAVDVKGVKVRGIGVVHATIMSKFPVIANTGYFIAEKFFYPGDALNVPKEPVEILAFPVIAPWMNIADSCEYVQKVKPKFSFPVHDGFLKSGGGPYYRMSEMACNEVDTKWVVIEDGTSVEF